MAKFKGAVLKCQACGTEYKVPPCRAKKSKFCSLKCSEKHRLDGLIVPRVELTCLACGRTFTDHRSKAPMRRYCSKDCQHGHSTYLEGLAQRSTGANNGMWAGGVSNHTDGYIYERHTDHPYASRGYVLQHRLVAERWLRENLPDSPFLIQLGDNSYLKPEYVVHHKNLDRKDNRVENLQVVTNSEHQKIHNALRKQQSTTPGH